MLQIDFNNILSTRLGLEHGLTLDELSKYLKENQYICPEIESERSQGKHPFLDLPYQDISLIEKIVTRKQGKSFRDFVVLGIGGSALGAKAIHNALCEPFYNLLTLARRKNYPRFFVLDNIDPEETNNLFKILSPKQTLFNIVTKSGSTLETIASFMIACDFLKKRLGKHYKKHLIITTHKNHSFMRQFAIKEGISSFEVPDGVEGRYSVLSPVGLVPAAFLGIDCSRLLSGARWMAEICRTHPPKKNLAYLIALVNFLMDKYKNKHLVVIMPYTKALIGVAEWIRQLWAESLGKRFNLKNEEVFIGPTPIVSLGVTDQHSQIQLYNEGPNNKLIIFLEVENFRQITTIPYIFKDDPEVGFLAKQTFNELIKYEKIATELALTKNQRPNYTIQVKNISAETLGALFYLWELATVYAGKLYNVNPFNQPGVEAGKKIALALMHKPGYENLLVENRHLLRKEDKWVIKY